MKRYSTIQIYNYQLQCVGASHFRSNYERVWRKICITPHSVGLLIDQMFDYYYRGQYIGSKYAVDDIGVVGDYLISHTESDNIHYYGFVKNDQVSDIVHISSYMPIRKFDFVGGRIRITLEPGDKIINDFDRSALEVV